MSLTQFALARYLFVVLFLAAAFIIGLAALARLRFANSVERLALCTAFGLGILSHLILLIGLIGFLTLSGVIALIVVAVLVSLWFLRAAGWEKTDIQSNNNSGTRWRLAVIILLVMAALLFIPIWMLALYPPTDFDTTMYHLAAPKVWIRAHRIIATPFLRGQVFPHSAHTIFAALMLLNDDISAQIFSLSTAVLVGLGLFGWGKQLAGISAGLLAAALWLGSRAMIAMAELASYHALATLFAFASVVAFANYVKRRQPTWLFAAAAFVGFAESTWSLTIYFIPVFAAATIYVVWKERNVRPLLLGIAGMLLGWGPALLRALWYTRNPTYPLFTEIFGTGPWWTPQDVAGMARDVRRFGLPRNLWNFIALPYWLIAKTQKFQSTVSYAVPLFAFLPFTVVLAARDKQVRWLGVIVLFYTGCWFIFGQVMRYLMPVIPIFCAITGITVAWLIQRICRARLRLTIPMLAVVLVGTILPSVLFALKEERRLGPIPITKLERDTYLTTSIPSYSSLAKANAAPAPLYSLFGTNCAYYYDDLFMGDWFGPGRYSQIRNALTGGQALYDALHRVGAKYFLVTWRKTPVLLPYDHDFDTHFETINADSASELYLLRDLPMPVTAERTNLLQNPGFDELDQGWPLAWRHTGSPLINGSRAGAPSEPVAVAVDKANMLAQTVTIKPAQVYELTVKARSDTPAALFRIQINWIDATGRICDVFIRVCNANHLWSTFAARMIAPLSAQKAIVYAIGQTTDRVWLDSFFFRNVDQTTPDTGSITLEPH